MRPSAFCRRDDADQSPDAGARVFLNLKWFPSESVPPRLPGVAGSDLRLQPRFHYYSDGREWSLANNELKDA